MKGELKMSSWDYQIHIEETNDFEVDQILMAEQQTWIDDPSPENAEFVDDFYDDFHQEI